MPTSAAFFDLDKTVIAKSSTLAFGRPLFEGGLISRGAVLKSSYAQLVYLVAGADEDRLARLRDYSARMVEGWPVAQVRQIVEGALHELIQPLVYTQALHLIAAHKAAGREVVIISSSGEDVVAPIGRLVGADRVIATRVRVESGRYTSDIEFYAYGAYKAAAMREIAAANGYDLTDCYAYSDSATDAPMLDAVGHPTAVNPDRALRRLANQRNWPIAHFGRPRRIRPAIRVPAAFRGRLRMPAPVTGRLAASLAAVLALGAGGAIFVSRRAPAAHAQPCIPRT
ncbi:MAG: HAD family hydrolase [Frankiaceae bacterium]